MCKPYTITKNCLACNNTGVFISPEGNELECAYCRGTKKITNKAVHPSHCMTVKRSEILAPNGTPRFYSIRNCENCQLEEWEHPAGHFFNGLEFPCKKKGRL